MAKILVVDDERSVRRAFEAILSDKGHTVIAVRGAEDALGLLPEDEFDLIVLDICLPGMNGFDAFAQIRQCRPKLPVIIMTGQGTTDTAIEATKRGAFDYQLKPFEPALMLRTIAKALESSRLMRGHVALGPETIPSAGEAIVGRSPPMQQLYKAIGRVAPTDVTVLIRGESGTGKELVARAIYHHSLRSGQSLMVVNCAAIPETLLESELFGHEAGAFTGTATRRIGKFEQAHGGTIFLDEIGDMSLMVQAKILRVLQEQTFQRLGNNETLQVDVRILCATNRNLEKAIAEGRFREDLYHRLNVVTLCLPPLRDRRDDIPLLVDYFMNRCARGRTSRNRHLPGCAMEAFQRYAWPGNVRELEHLIQSLMIFTGGYTIQVSDLPLALHVDATPVGCDRDATGREMLRQLVAEFLDSYHGDRAHDEWLDGAESVLIQEALEGALRGIGLHAGRLLGLPAPPCMPRCKNTASMSEPTHRRPSARFPAVPPACGR